MKPVTLQKLHDGQRTIAAAFKNNRRVVIRCGRRFGKTTLLERCALKWALSGKLVGWFGPQYRLNTPSYNRIARNAGDFITRKSKIDQIIEMRGGGSVEFWTLNDPDAGRSRFYDVAIIDEASLVGKGLQETWEQAIAPTLLDRGGSAVMAGTPKGKDLSNFFYKVCTQKEKTDSWAPWLEFHAPTSANPTLNIEEVARLKNEYPALVYQQEYLAEFVDWSGDTFFDEAKMLVDGLPVSVPAKVDYVAAFMDTATKAGRQHDGTGLVICAFSRFPEPRLTILDWDYVQIEGSFLEAWLPTVFTRLDEYAKICNARAGSAGVFIEDKSSGMVLIQQAARRGWPARAIDSKLTSVGKDERAISISGYVHKGMVKWTQPARDKTVKFKGVVQNHFRSQVLGYRVGQKDEQDDLLDCFCYAVALSCGNKSGF